MRMLRAWIAGCAVFAAVLPVEAAAQSSGSLGLYGKGHFKGARRSVAGPRTYIDPPIVVRSVMVPPGTQWELCSGSTFSGCRQISQSVPAMVMTVRSVRPVAAVLAASPSAPGQPPVPGGRGQSLRGHASEYFVAPDLGGNRIEVQPATGEATARRAGEFCRSRGWRRSAHERLQTVGGRVFLVDVLCVDTAE